MNEDPQYEWSLKKLSGEFVEFFADHPEAGRFRKKGKNNQWVPIALWWDGERDEQGELTEDAELLCLVGFAHDAHYEDGYELWTYIADNIVTPAHYREAFDTGRWWDDPPRPRGIIGDNLPEDPLEAIKQELEGEAEVVKEFLAKPVTTQAQADQIGPWVKRILRIKQRADSLHAEAKRPILDAARAIEDKWRPPRSFADELANKLRHHLQGWLIAQKRAEQERASAAAAEAARLREEAHALASEEFHLRSKAQEEELLRQAKDQEQRAAPQPVSAGRTGAKIGLRTERRAKVKDYKLAAIALLDMNGPIAADLRDKIDQLAQRVVKSGLTPPGVEVEELEIAR